MPLGLLSLFKKVDQIVDDLQHKCLPHCLRVRKKRRRGSLSCLHLPHPFIKTAPLTKFVKYTRTHVCDSVLAYFPAETNRKQKGHSQGPNLLRVLLRFELLRQRHKACFCPYLHMCMMYIICRDMVDAWVELRIRMPCLKGMYSVLHMVCHVQH